MMLKVLSNPLVLAVLYSVSFCQGNPVCTYDHDQVLNEGGVEVEVRVRNAIRGAHDDGYWNLNFHSGWLENIKDIKAWCVDIERRIRGNRVYEVDVLSSMDSDVTTLHYTDAVDKPEYLPAVNYLINHYNSGSIITIEGCVDDHYLTDQEFQLAVWTLVDHHPDPYRVWRGEDDDHRCVVNYLVEKGEENKNYEPDCTNPGELIGLFVIVDDDTTGETYGEIQHQTLVAEVPLYKTDICECNLGGDGFGDPHFKTWAGEYYDFHGVCDLTFIKNPEFQNGLGMDIQIRTTRMGLWSYISSAAIRIGEDVLEIVGGQTDREYLINGIPGEEREENDASNGIILMSTLSGYEINYKQGNKQREFTIELGKGDKIVFNTWNLFVGVHMKNSQKEHFQNSVGLMGSFPQGLKLARDNVSIMGDSNSFGQEWQVLSSEPKLFHNIEGPQHPDSCDIPTSSEMRRRLEESIITIEEATEACANAKADLIDLCVFDVMATNDEFSAGAY